MKAIKITRPQSGGYIQGINNEATLLYEWVVEELRDLCKEGSIDDSITFTLVEVDEEEYTKLPEFEGW